MEKIIDLHTHLDTLGVIASFIGKRCDHTIRLEEHIKDNYKIILSVSMYVPLLSSYESLRTLILNFKKKALKYPGVKLIKTKKDLDSDFLTGLILHIESARTITNHKTQLPELYELGIRGIIPMHFVNNQIGFSCDDIRSKLSALNPSNQGLKKYGKEFIQHCNSLGIWLDLAHCSDQTAKDILNLSNSVLISHIGVRDLISRDRNQTVCLMKKVANKGGVIGITPWTHLIGHENNAFNNQLHYLINQGLENNICIGSDFGAPINTLSKNNSIYHLSREINADFKSLKDKIKWKNAYNFFNQALPN